jgi:hypothetical protein
VAPTLISRLRHDADLPTRLRATQAFHLVETWEAIQRGTHPRPRRISWLIRHPVRSTVSLKLHLQRKWLGLWWPLRNGLVILRFVLERLGLSTTNV